MLAVASHSVHAQRPSGSSATAASAELVKGRLSPAESKPGDQITVKLKEDVKSNGDIVLKKGAIILGVVQHVNRTDGKGESVGQVQSLIEVQWTVPKSEYAPSRELMIAVQSVSQLSHLARQDGDKDWDVEPSPVHTPRGNRLVNQSTATPNPKSNEALLNMPSVLAADTETATALNKTLGLNDSSQLFATGHGQIITPGGSKDSIDIFSHLDNDSVLTSRSRNFEITSGAQIQLLVGVHKSRRNQ
jgi:hypothetical protein